MRGSSLTSSPPNSASPPAKRLPTYSATMIWDWLVFFWTSHTYGARSSYHSIV